MKLENITLCPGDIITMRTHDGKDETKFHLGDDSDDLDINNWIKDKILKIERYKKISGDGILGVLYNLETIWEKPKEQLLTDKEKEFFNKLNEFLRYKITTFYISEGTNKVINMYTSSSAIYSLVVKGEYFNNLILGKKYTLEELGL